MVIVAYDSAWPSLFEQERTLLQATIGAWLSGPIEHIGSTAVPGLAAKPIIDIMAGVETLAASTGAIAAAGTLGYIHYPYRPDVMHWLCKPSASFRTHHLHLVPYQSALWNERLAFRDHLRRDAAAAADYGALKMGLARQYTCDREAYTEAKGPFIRRILEGARSQDPER